MNERSEELRCHYEKRKNHFHSFPKTSHDNLNIQKQQNRIVLHGYYNQIANK